eukprot:1149711-Pyramimonas_sp.AAC.2
MEPTEREGRKSEGLRLKFLTPRVSPPVEAWFPPPPPLVAALSPRVELAPSRRLLTFSTLRCVSLQTMALRWFSPSAWRDAWKKLILKRLLMSF